MNRVATYSSFVRISHSVFALPFALTGALLALHRTAGWTMWRWNFFIAIPFAVVALVMMQRTLHLPPRPKTKARIDYLGIVLLSTAVSLLLIWVTNAGSSYDWWSTETVLMVGGALLAAVLFVIVELRSKEPLVPLTMFRNRTFTLAVVASIAIGIAMFGTSVFLSQYMQMARGATPTEAGLMTIPMIAGLLLASIVIGGLVTRHGHWKPYLVVGGVLLIAGSYLLSTIHYDTNFVLVSLYMFLLGAGVGMTMQNLVLIVQNTAKPNEIGVASSGVTFFRSLGGTIGVSVMGAALASSATDLVAARKDDIGAAIMGLGEKGVAVAEQLQSGAIPNVAQLPESIRIIFEDIYAQAIAHSFLIAVPLAIVSLIAIIFLPNTPLTRMTTSERVAASEADLATVSTAEGMDALTATGTVETVTDASAARSADTTTATTEPAGDAADAASRVTRR